MSEFWSARSGGADGAAEASATNSPQNGISLLGGHRHAAAAFVPVRACARRPTAGPRPREHGRRAVAGADLQQQHQLDRGRSRDRPRRLGPRPQVRRLADRDRLGAHRRPLHQRGRRIRNGHRVRLGADYIDNDEGATYRIDRMVRHADWNKTEPRSTISPWSISSPTIRHNEDNAGPIEAIPLYDGPPLEPGVDVFATGWGQPEAGKGKGFQSELTCGRPASPPIAPTTRNMRGRSRIISYARPAARPATMPIHAPATAAGRWSRKATSRSWSESSAGASAAIARTAPASTSASTTSISATGSSARWRPTRRSARCVSDRRGCRDRRCCRDRHCCRDRRDCRAPPVLFLVLGAQPRPLGRHDHDPSPSECATLRRVSRMAGACDSAGSGEPDRRTKRGDIAAPSCDRVEQTDRWRAQISPKSPTARARSSRSQRLVCAAPLRHHFGLLVQSRVADLARPAVR